MTTLWLIVGCGVLAILYGIWATLSVLGADQGSAKMQEISAAVREGAQAYLKRQYTTIGIVGVVIFVIIGFTLGWLVAAGFAVGAILSGATGFIGMNGSVGANVSPAPGAAKALAGRRPSRPPACSRSPARPAPSPACWWRASRCWASRFTSASSRTPCIWRRT